MAAAELDWMTRRPIAHRGLHGPAIPENSLAAARAACDAGYSIELDLQLSCDGIPMIFHDNTLDRMAGVSGDIRDFTAAELGALRLGGSAEPIPTLAGLLETVGGRAGLVLELKGRHGKDDGFAAAVMADLARHDGPVAVMSFSHRLLRDLDAARGGAAIGLTAEGDDARYPVHREIADAIAFDFLSYGIADLPCRFASEFRRSHRPVICWTVRSPAEAAAVAAYTDQITFEGYLPA